MPQTLKQIEHAQKNPAFCQLLPLLEFVDDFAVLRTGVLGALYRIAPLNTYYLSDERRNQISEALHALLRSLPDNRALRLQVRYDTTEGVGPLLEAYQQRLHSTHPVLQAIDREQLERWRERDKKGEFLTRQYHVAFELDPRLYTLFDGQDSAQPSNFGLLDRFLPNRTVERSYEEHQQIRVAFESLLAGYQSLFSLAGLEYHRLTSEEISLELQRVLNPTILSTRPYRPELGTRSVREWIANSGIEEEGPGWLQMSGLLYSVLTVKLLPEYSFPGLMRKLIELDFPLSCSAEIVVPGESKIHRALTKRLTRTESAQRGYDNQKRTDLAAEVAGHDITETLRAILAGRERVVECSLTVVVRTSKPILTEADRSAAQHELVRRRERVRATLVALEGAQALAEREAFRRLYINSLPAIASRNRREIECSSQEAANFLPLEGPWEGMSRAPLILFETPMRQLLGFSMFDGSLSNYNMLMVAAAGSGKSFQAQVFALMASRSNPMVCVIEAGVTYQPLTDLMGGRTIHVSLDGEHAINPWDLPAGQKRPSNEKKAELKNLTLEMLRSSSYGDAAEADPAILESVLDSAVDEIYQRFAESSDVPTYAELYSELEHWQDKVPGVKEQARKAAVRLKPWVLNGTYASLFDRRTTFSPNQDWLYFNVKPLNADKRLASTYPLVIAQQMAVRSTANHGRRSVVILDENWAMLDSPHMAPQVEQSFRTARTNNASIWGISQAVEDYTGSPERPRPAGPGILNSSAMKWVGVQTGDGSALRQYLHLSDEGVAAVKRLGPPQKGRSSEMLLVMGEKAETTQTVRLVPSPLLYWICTSYAREKNYRSWYLDRHRGKPLLMLYQELAQRFPCGLADLPALPEEELFEPEASRQRLAATTGAPAA